MSANECLPHCMQVRALLNGLAEFASALLRTRQLQVLNTALNARPLAELLAYYGPRPELAKYTLEHELTRMEYRVRTADGVELRSPEAIRAHYESLDEAGQGGLLWRLANQSLLADLISELHANGFVDIALGASVRATSDHLGSPRITSDHL